MLLPLAQIDICFPEIIYGPSMYLSNFHTNSQTYSDNKPLPSDNTMLRYKDTRLTSPKLVRIDNFDNINNFDNIKFYMFIIITLIVSISILHILYIYYEQKRDFEKFRLPESVIKTNDTHNKYQANSNNLYFRNWANRQKHVINYTYDPICVTNDTRITIHAIVENEV
jgi:cell division protein FtsL